MTKTSRRAFLSTTAAGTATLGALLALPGLTEAAPSPAHFNLTREELSGPVVVHVRDFATGEMALLVGTREIVFRDREMLHRLGKAVQHPLSSRPERMETN